MNSSINGIRAALNANSVRANNIANINSRGYKSRRSLQLENANGSPQISAVSMDLSQGPLRISGQPSDIAIEGRGFFQVEEADGRKLFTRSVKLQRNPDGNISDSRGNRIAGAVGIIEEGHDIIVHQDGTLFSRDNQGNQIQIGKLMVVNFNNPQGLVAVEGGYFRASANSGQGMPANPEFKVLQGVEEMSNVDLAEQMVGQIIDEKSLKANVQALKTQDRMLGEIVDLKG
jgi:flagellar basal body rod protein FlgG